ncbi:MAG: adenine phosphoribosyltransferase [Elusimicrobia bacterium]|nr:adenine phosphoribosyltransferase [Elusimicrobiota bacterium]
MEIKDSIIKAVRDIPDFPVKGVIFKDITPILSDIDLYNKIVEIIVDKYKGRNITKIVALESRGFIFGISIAQKLNIPFIPVRKKGKLPYKTVSATYNLEYGTSTVEMHIDAVNETDNVLIVDDLLATGGTACAAIELVKKLKGNVAACAFVIELTFLNGKDKLKDIEYSSIVQY